MKIIRNDDGFVLIVALLIMVVLTIIGIAATRNTSLELMIAGNDKVHKRTLYQAEAGAVLSTEVLEQNINCLTGFGKTGTVGGIDFADLEGTIRVWSRTTNGRNALAMYLDPLPWTTTNCNITDPLGPNISYPISNIGSTVELTDSYVGGHAEMLPGGSLQMASGYERKGKSAAGGGTARIYDIISRHRGLNNSQSTLIFGWRHLVGEESECKY
ncbi:MAG: pilus assembly PilX N-terminal domain-containing protein [Desulfoarculaceae bacterium]|nr:pilus assembly PilX N-terminal domain-containing protein [Desulfoarculaceae bacterium]